MFLLVCRCPWLVRRIAALYNSRRNTCHYGMRRYIVSDYCVGPNDYVIAYGDRSYHFCPGAYLHVVANRGEASLIAYSNLLEHLAVAPHAPAINNGGKTMGEENPPRFVRFFHRSASVG